MLRRDSNRRRRVQDAALTSGPATGRGPSLNDPIVQREELMAMRHGFAFNDPWGSGALTLRATVASGVLFVALCGAFCGVYYLVFVTNRSKAHLAVIHMVVGSITFGVVLTAVVVSIVLGVRRVRTERETQRLILERRRQDHAVRTTTGWSGSGTQPPQR